MVCPVTQGDHNESKYSEMGPVRQNPIQITVRSVHMYYYGRPMLIGQTIIFLPCDFYLSTSFFFSSPNLGGRRLDVYHTSIHGVALVRI